MKTSYEVYIHKNDAKMFEAFLIDRFVFKQAVSADGEQVIFLIFDVTDKDREELQVFKDLTNLEMVGIDRVMPGKEQNIIEKEVKYFVTLPNLVFDIKFVNGFEFRSNGHSSLGEVYICFKNNKYLSVKMNIEEYNYLSKEFIRILQLADLCFDEYIFMDLITFSSRRLCSFEYRGQERGNRSCLTFKDGQYLLPHLSRDEYNEIVNKITI